MQDQFLFMKRGEENSQNRHEKSKEMKIFRKTAGCTRMDKKNNADSYRELDAVPLLDYLEDYRYNFITRIYPMKKYRIQRQMKKGLIKKRYTWIDLTKDRMVL